MVNVDYQVDVVRFRLGGFRVGDHIYDPLLSLMVNGRAIPGIVVAVDAITAPFATVTVRWEAGRSNHNLQTPIREAAVKLRPWRDA